MEQPSFDETVSTETVTFGRKQELLLRVSNGTDVHRLSTSLRKAVDTGAHARVVISCIGVQTINQAVKAVAIANERSAPQGYLLMMYPYFHMERKEDVDHTIMRFAIIKHLIGSL